MLVLKQRTVKETLMNYGSVQKEKQSFVCLLYGCSVSVLFVVVKWN